MTDSDAHHSPSSITRTEMDETFDAWGESVGENASLRDLEGLGHSPDVHSGFSRGGEFSRLAPLTAANPPTPPPIEPDGSPQDDERVGRIPISVGMCGSCFFIRGHGHRELCPMEDPDGVGSARIVEDQERIPKRPTTKRAPKEEGARRCFPPSKE